MNETTLYLDHAATTPARPEAAAAVDEVMRRAPGNASSAHAAGRRARAALEEARERVAGALGATPTEILFTSGGTESDNLAVIGRWRATRGGIVLSAIEHSAVREAAGVAAREGAPVTALAVDEEGRVDLGALEEALQEPGISVVSVMWGNNEVGTLQPVSEIGSRCAERGVAFHTDAVQAVGHVPVNVERARCSLLSLSAHKIGGPTGVGAHKDPPGPRHDPQLSGGGQDRQRRDVAEVQEDPAAGRARAARLES